MSRRFPQALFALIFGLLIVTTPSHSFASTTGGGACPGGANYLSLSNPQAGGGQGSVTLASLGITSCYYVSAAGSDSNSGTSESSPWLHAPGMPACSSNCAAVSPTGGEGFILRGGDTWHRNSGAPSTGGTWNWGYSGSSITTPIYLGVDFTWYAGSSFARPMINEDNPITNSSPSGCPYPMDGITSSLSFGGQSYVIFDALEFTGDCTSGGSGGRVVDTGDYTIAERLYMHGWSIASSAGDDAHPLLANGTGGTPNNQNRKLFIVIDGSDSTFGNKCTTPTCVATDNGTGNSNITGLGTMWAVSDCWDVEYTVIHHTSQGFYCGDAGIIHDNDLEYIFEPAFGGRHGNVFEIITPGSGYLCTNLIAYNNTTANTIEGVNWWPQCPNFYLFNNSWLNSGHFAPDANGLMLSPPGSSGSSVVKAYLYNNTFQANSVTAGPANQYTPGWAAGSGIYFENNHIMDFTSISSFFGCRGNNCTTVQDNGGEVFQTTNTANLQGYVIGNDYGPATDCTGATSGAHPCATLAAGNSSTAFCNTVAALNAAAGTACLSGSSGGVAEQSGWGGLIAVYPANPVNQRTGAWDAGAYEFASGSGSTPVAPTGLAAVVQ
jgi:hypothetical protein